MSSVITNTIIIRRSASHNDITVNGTAVSLSPPGANREARRFLMETLFPNAKIPHALRKSNDIRANGTRPARNRKRK